MSKSFRDAIHFILFLGLRYIWIDSLCICQDDAYDCQREAAKMSSVYSNAALTVSVTGVEDGSIGAFGHRQSRDYVQLRYTHGDGSQGNAYALPLSLEKEYVNAKYITMDHEPLFFRGWCLQERVLSRRILHFAGDQMYFECMQGIRNEEGLRMPNRFFLAFSATTTYVYPSAPTLFLIPWNLAMAGLAESIVMDGIKCAEPVPHRPPSWSWAAIDDMPGHSIRGDEGEPVAHILDFHANLVHDNPFGEVKGAWIKMDAPLVPITLTESLYRGDDPGTGLPVFPKILSFEIPVGEQDLRGSFDFIGEKHVEVDTVERNPSRIFALVLAVDYRYETGCFCLLVMPAEQDKTDTVRRVGRIDLDVCHMDMDDEYRTVLSLV
ncbi:hypothetical protein GQ53DRAFT_848661 [Thozetella sp. PMI_491]|nr:hypothetical protein GQ53DRAFT_848661 [Thozetella sp. PMI_491]